MCPFSRSPSSQDKYDGMSKEQRALLLCGHRIEAQHPMYRRQIEKIKSLALPRENTDRSNRNNMPNGRLMPNFPFIQDMIKVILK